MRWHATTALDEAYAATRAVLLPVTLRRWLVLGFVVFFVGWSVGILGSINLPSGGLFDVPGGTTLPDVFLEIESLDFTFTLPESVEVSPLFLVPFAIGMALLGLVFSVLAAIMQFVFVNQLTDMDIRLRGYVGPSLGPGARLFAFWLAIALGLVVLGLAMVLLTILTFGLFALVLVLLIPVFFLGGVALWVVFRFTIDFVVPIMLVEEVGVLSAWQRLYAEVRTEWRQFGLYAGIRFVLDIVAGIAFAAGGFIVLLAVAIPALIVGFALYGLLAVMSSTLATLVAGLVAVVALLIVAVVTTVVVGVPVHTYLRYYALFALARISPQYDLLDEVRAAMDSSEQAA